jgi:hypothetical protein
MSEGYDEKPAIVEGNGRAEREFKVMMFVVAGLLVAIVVVALGYGVLSSTPDTATMIPHPDARSSIAGKASVPPVSDGTGAAHRNTSAAR